MLCLSLSRAENGSYSQVKQIQHYLLSLSKEYVTSLESAVYACEEMNILPRSSNADKNCHGLLLESTAQSSENPEGMRSAR